MREAEDFAAGDDFQIERLAPGQILLKKIPRARHRVRLRKGKLPTFDVPNDAPPLTLETVNRLRDE
jgi:hypothetical protein